MRNRHGLWRCVGEHHGVWGGKSLSRDRWREPLQARIASKCARVVDESESLQRRSANATADASTSIPGEINQQRTQPQATAALTGVVNRRAALTTFEPASAFRPIHDIREDRPLGRCQVCRRVGQRLAELAIHRRGDRIEGPPPRGRLINTVETHSLPTRKTHQPPALQLNDSINILPEGTFSWIEPRKKTPAKDNDQDALACITWFYVRSSHQMTCTSLEDTSRNFIPTGTGESKYLAHSIRMSRAPGGTLLGVNSLMSVGLFLLFRTDLLFGHAAPLASVCDFVSPCRGRCAFAHSANRSPHTRHCACISTAQRTLTGHLHVHFFSLD